MSTTAPTPPPTAEELERFPDLVALSGSPMPDLVGNHEFASGVYRAKLTEACDLVDLLRIVLGPGSSESLRDHAVAKVERFFTSLKREPQVKEEGT